MCTVSTVTSSSVRSSRRGRHLLPLALLGTTTSCPTTTTRQRLPAEQGRDVPYFRHQVVEFHLPFYQAISICKVKLPDLTGDPEVQSSALAWNIPFTIRPKADAEITAFNRDHIIDTGSHLPGPHPSPDLAGGVYE